MGGPSHGRWKGKGADYPIVPLSSLPPEIHRLLVLNLRAEQLSCAQRSCTKFRGIVSWVAEKKLRAWRPWLARGPDQCPCWLRSLAAVESIVDTVGPRLEERVAAIGHIELLRLS